MERLTPEDLADLRVAQQALDFCGRFLARKYRLGPQDRIDDDGTITRSPLSPPQATEQSTQNTEAVNKG